MLRDTSYANKWSIATKNLRKRGIYKKIADYAELAYNQNILELGVGVSGLLSEVCKRVNSKDSLVVGIDSNQEALGISKRVLEKEGHDVNLALRTYYENDMLYINQNTPVQLEQGKINLIGDIYGLSDYNYLHDNEFDRIFFTFSGGTLHTPLEMIGKAMDDVSEFMKDDGIFVHVEKEFTFPGKLSNAESLLHVTNRLELIDSMFKESIDDFVTSFYPLTLATGMSTLDRTRSSTQEFRPKGTLKYTIKDFKKRFRNQHLMKFGFMYSKFRKKMDQPQIKYDDVLGSNVGKEVIFYMPYQDREQKFGIKEIKGKLTKGPTGLYGIHGKNAHMILMPGLPGELKIGDKTYDFSSLVG